MEFNQEFEMSSLNGTISFIPDLTTGAEEVLKIAVEEYMYD
jgi:hypothetical protein